ncbi:MAG: hypothetical protein V4733_00490 [Verrucomicrobiota bacterium]
MRHPGIIVTLAAAAAAFAVSVFIPGTALDRFAFRIFAKEEAHIRGSGTDDDPWRLTHTKSIAPQSHLVVSLGDDTHGTFQSNPPAPLDFAVILKKSRSLATRGVAIGTPLSWDAPYPLGLAALDKELAAFPEVITTAPLSRGPMAEPLPPPFLRASLPVSKVHGNASLLPIVNRIPLPGIICGGDNALAGFLTIDSEISTDAPILIARWKDRLVFSFPLIVALRKWNLTTADLRVVPGSFIALGDNGPRIPIDEFGRLAIPPANAPTSPEIPVEALFDSGLQQTQKPSAWMILRDDRSGLPAASRDATARFDALLATFATPDRVVRRLGPVARLAGLALTCLALAAAAQIHRRLLRRSVAGFAIAGIMLVTWLALREGYWLSPWPPLAAGIVAAITACFVRARIAGPASADSYDWLHPWKTTTESSVNRRKNRRP